MERWKESCKIPQRGTGSERLSNAMVCMSATAELSLSPLPAPPAVTWDCVCLVPPFLSKQRRSFILPQQDFLFLTRRHKRRSVNTSHHSLLQGVEHFTLRLVTWLQLCTKEPRLPFSQRETKPRCFALVFTAPIPIICVFTHASTSLLASVATLLRATSACYLLGQTAFSHNLDLEQFTFVAFRAGSRRPCSIRVPSRRAAALSLATAAAHQWMSSSDETNCNICILRFKNVS